MKALIAKFLDKTFWKFILVGVVNTIFGTAVMFGFYNLLHCNYWVSSMANYVLGSILSFILNKYFTFKNDKKSFKQILVFIIHIAICYFVAYGLAKPMVAYILSTASKSVQENLAMLVGMGLFVILNYIGQRLFVFKTQEEQKNDNID